MDYTLKATLFVGGIFALSTLTTCQILKLEDKYEEDNKPSLEKKVEINSVEKLFIERQSLEFNPQTYAIKPEEDRFAWDYDGFWNSTYLPKV